MAVNYRQNIDVFLCAGQSNMRGRGNSAQSESINDLRGYQYSNAVFYHLEDPIRNIQGDANTGSLLPAFAKTWTDNTSRGVFVCNTAKGGTALVLETEDNWQKSDNTLYTAALNEFNALLAAIKSDTLFTINSINFMWCQGERDAQNGVTGSQYEIAFNQMLSDFKSDLKIENFYIFALGNRTDEQFDSSFDAIRQAQIDVAASRSDTLIATNIAKDFRDEGKMNADGIHYTQAGYNELGDLGASTILNL